MRAALFALLVAGCYAPGIRDGQFKCEASTACPSGFTCQCGVCRSRPTDMACGAGQADLAGGGFTDGCSNGNRLRATSDLGLKDVAFCPAAWLVKGISSPAAKLTPCNKMPSTNGKSGMTDCSAEDNCAAGWHVCDSEADAMGLGLTKTLCEGLNLTGEFYATRQRGAPIMIPSPGPPSCAEPPDRLVFGCGGLGVSPVMNCTVLTRALADPPGGQDDCSVATSGSFQCPGADMLNPEAHVIIKPVIDRGGVICCRNP